MSLLKGGIADAEFDFKNNRRCYNTFYNSEHKSNMTVSWLNDGHIFDITFG